VTTNEELAAYGLPHVLRPQEVAKVLRVSSKTVSRWVKAGKLRGYKTLGGHTRFDTQDIIDMLVKLGISHEETLRMLAQKVERR
jgi:excisionase family DNA binding protein